MNRHPLLGLWIVMVPDSSVTGGQGPLIGRNGGELYVLCFKNVVLARKCANDAGGGDVVLVVEANIRDITTMLVTQGVHGIVVDWVPGQPTIEEARPLAG